jgi:hypothetical protein
MMSKSIMDLTKMVHSTFLIDRTSCSNLMNSNLSSKEEAEEAEADEVGSLVAKTKEEVVVAQEAAVEAVTRTTTIVLTLLP